MTTTLDVARARAGRECSTSRSSRSNHPTRFPPTPKRSTKPNRRAFASSTGAGRTRSSATGSVTALETVAVASVFDEQGRFAPVFEAGTDRAHTGRHRDPRRRPGRRRVLPRRAGARANPRGRRAGRRADAAHVAPPDLGGRRRREGPAQSHRCDRRRPASRGVDPRCAHGRRDRIGPRGPRRAADAASAASTATTTRSRGDRSRRRRPSGGSASARSRSATTKSDAPPRRSALPALLRQRDALARALHPLRSLRRRVPARTASRSSGRIASGAGTEQQSVLLLDEDTCIRCGLCVNRCPPGALSMVHARELTHD